jgi:hypothetical protein
MVHYHHLQAQGIVLTTVVAVETSRRLTISRIIPVRSLVPWTEFPVFQSTISAKLPIPRELDDNVPLGEYQTGLEGHQNIPQVVFTLGEEGLVVIRTLFLI